MYSKTYSISFRDSNKFSKLACDLADSDSKLIPFVESFFSLDRLFEKAVKRRNFPVDRACLTEVLCEQYEGMSGLEQVLLNIEALKDENTFTVCSGHQLCLLGGPLYVVYKIAHSIKLCSEFNARYNQKKLVPVFWLASEDHDFEEAAHVYWHGQKLRWDAKHEGQAVGRMAISDMQHLWRELDSMLPDGPKKKEIISFLQTVYKPGVSMAKAMRQLLHKLFGKHGLIILDADDHRLKKKFLPLAKTELSQGLIYKKVNEQSQVLAHHYPLQVHPRELNLFMFDGEIRKRLDKLPTGEVAFQDGSKRFLPSELEQLWDENPSLVSPNVLMRPMYQELVLPNLAYIGGAGEMAYWLQLRQSFDEMQLSFPLIILRNSSVLCDRTDLERWKELGLEWTDLFLPIADLERKLASKDGSESLEKLDLELNAVIEAYSSILSQMKGVSEGLARHIESKLSKEDHFNKSLKIKLLREYKRRNHAKIEKVRSIHQLCFPGGTLQERKETVFAFVYDYGFELIDHIIESFEVEHSQLYLFELAH